MDAKADNERLQARAKRYLQSLNKQLLLLRRNNIKFDKEVSAVLSM